MIKARAKTAPPIMKTRRGPTRSASQPKGGLDSPCTRAKTANAPATSERLQWSSSARTTRKTEYAYHTPYARPSVTKVATRDWFASERTFIPKTLDFNRSGRRNRKNKLTDLSFFTYDRAHCASDA